MRTAGTEQQLFAVRQACIVWRYLAQRAGTRRRHAQRLRMKDSTAVPKRGGVASGHACTSIVYPGVQLDQHWLSLDRLEEVRWRLCSYGGVDFRRRACLILCHSPHGSPLLRSPRAASGQRPAIRSPDVREGSPNQADSLTMLALTLLTANAAARCTNRQTVQNIWDRFWD